MQHRSYPTRPETPTPPTVPLCACTWFMAGGLPPALSSGTSSAAAATRRPPSGQGSGAAAPSADPGGPTARPGSPSCWLGSVPTASTTRRRRPDGYTTHCICRTGCRVIAVGRALRLLAAIRVALVAALTGLVLAIAALAYVVSFEAIRAFAIETAAFPQGAGLVGAAVGRQLHHCGQPGHPLAVPTRRRLA
jgi:hypothetical protein